MSLSDGNGLCLDGDGAAYVRVSDDEQDVQRQYTAIHGFEERHRVTIPQQHWFKDEGWARDTADRRPDFLRLMKLAETGRVKWIVVSERDRFGTTDADEFIHFRYLLRKYGCRLYDAAGTDWTRKDIATVITAVVDGEKSEQEQHGISKRVLGGKVEKARAGEWQGGPVRLGFDVACYDRETGRELWRVVFEGRTRRQKVYPDGRAERFDGEGNFPKFQEKTEVLRVAPSNDKAKVAAAVSVFQRYAAEAIGFTALAHHLNQLGFRNSYGGLFQGPHVEAMLEDPIYLGYYTYNRRHSGKFHRWADGQTVLELNYEEKQSKNAPADWVQSRRLFEPLVDRPTWEAVQRKLGQRSTRPKAPRSAALYLAERVYCGNCGRRMVAGAARKRARPPREGGPAGKRYEYMCGGYFKAIREGWPVVDGVRRKPCGCRRAGCACPREECSCLRNGVFQDVLEGYVERYLEETGRRLELLTEGLDADGLTERLRGQEAQSWRAFSEGIARLTGYLAAHCPDDYDALLEEYARQAADVTGAPGRGAPNGGPARPRGFLAGQLGERGRAAHARHKGDATTPGGFVDACLACYRAVFDPAEVAAKIERLEAEHTALMGQWADLPTPRAKEKARERFAALEARIEELKQQSHDAAAVVEQQFREMLDLQRAVADARRALRGEAGERALRQRAQALAGVIQRIECAFTATGQTGAGWGKKNSRLVKVTVYPVVGEPLGFSADSKLTLLYSSAHSCM